MSEEDNEPDQTKAQPLTQLIRNTRWRLPLMTGYRRMIIRTKDFGEIAECKWWRRHRGDVPLVRDTIVFHQSSVWTVEDVGDVQVDSPCHLDADSMILLSLISRGSRGKIDD